MALGSFARPAILAVGLAAFAAVSALAAPAVAQALQSTVEADSDARLEERDRLFRFLAHARTETEGRAMEHELWLFWLQAPDAIAAELMNEALDRRRRYDLAGSRAVLDRLLEHAPEWAEAWNQRATVRFEQGDLDGSLLDVEEVLRREPKHFGAMAGQAIILMRHGRFEAAQSILKRATSIHPFLRERSMILDRPGGGEERGI